MAGQSLWNVDLHPINSLLTVVPRVWRWSTTRHPAIVLLLVIGFSGCKDDGLVILPNHPEHPPIPQQQTTWDFVGLQGEYDISSLAVVQDKPWILYAGIMSDFSAGTLGKIWKSTDWGSSWKTVVDSISVSSIAIHPHNDSILYAGLGSNNGCIPGIIKSTNAGGTWARVDTFDLYDMDVSVIRIDPVHPEIVYAGVTGFMGGGLLKTTNAGASWLVLPGKWSGSSSPLVAGVCGFAIDPNNTSELYAGVAWSGNLYKSYDAGETFSEVFQDSGISLPLAILVNPYRTNIVYTGLHPGGLLVSSDHGVSWSIKPQPMAAVQTISVYDDSTLFVSSYWYDSGGVFMSIDRGMTWRDIGPTPDDHHDPIATMAVDQGYGFVYAFDRNVARAGIYRYKIVR